LPKFLRYVEKRAAKRDHKKAAYWFQMSAKNNLTGAQFFIGSFFEDGTGVVEDLDKAIFWYEKAASGGDNGLWCINIVIPVSQTVAII